MSTCCQMKNIVATSGSIMSSNHQAIQAFIFDKDTKKLQVLDQTLLPQTFKYIDVPDSERGYSVIKNMMVRGAPCIAAVGCLSIIAELNQPQFIFDKLFTGSQITDWLRTKSSLVIKSRPTAVNLKHALDNLIKHAEDLLEKHSIHHDQEPLVGRQLIELLTNFCLDAIENGLALNKKLGDFGADEILKDSDRHLGVTVLTHCNTGSLATVGYGTALGVIRSLRNKGQLKRAYCTETRPYNQGSRLTAWELVKEKMPATLIADSMVAYLMSTSKIDAVLVGADCVAANGDTANKIGTLQIAVLAQNYKVPFYVAAPTQSISLTIEDQSQIKIEQRPGNELRRLDDIILAPDEVDVWNPCFDVTPSKLITGIITEYGVCKPNELKTFMEKVSKESNTNALF